MAAMRIAVNLTQARVVPLVLGLGLLLALGCQVSSQALQTDLSGRQGVAKSGGAAAAAAARGAGLAGAAVVGATAVHASSEGVEAVPRATESSALYPSHRSRTPRYSSSTTSRSSSSSSSINSSSGDWQSERRTRRSLRRHVRPREPTALPDYGASSLRKEQAEASKATAQVAAIRDSFSRRFKVRTFASTAAGVVQNTSGTPWCGFLKVPGCSGTCPWNTATAYARLDMYGCLQVSGIHTVQTYLKTIIVIDRTDSNNTLLKLPTNATQNAYAEELTLGGPNINDYVPFAERALDVKSNVFCSAGQVTADGTVFSIGGSSDASAAGADVLLNGSFSIRQFHPCSDGSCDFNLNVAQDMTSKRWYPTAQIMPDGRILIVGGSNVFGNIANNSPTRNNPTLEFYPRKNGEGNYYSQFLVDSLPFNLYPFVHVLPSGLVFLYAGHLWTLWDPATQSDVVRSGSNAYPPLNVTGDDNPQYPTVERSYPVSGTSFLFPLSSSNNYVAEVMVCGGNRADAIYKEGDRKTSTQVNPFIQADYRCYRITPEAATPTWTLEAMCNNASCTVKYRRVMGDAVLLADGNALIINGAEQGYQGLNPGFGNVPQLQPLIYLTKTHTWYPTSQLPASVIPRLYHSSALLLHDATVLITGSNPNPFIDFRSARPTELHVEKFIPPYLMTNLSRPVYVSSPKAMAVGFLYSIRFTATQASSAAALTQRFSVGLSYPGFSTHNQRHGMRHVWLDVKAVVQYPGANNTFVAILAAPPKLTIAPPTLYWMHLLDNSIPALEAASIKVTAALS